MLCFHNEYWIMPVAYRYPPHALQRHAERCGPRFHPVRPVERSRGRARARAPFEPGAFAGYAGCDTSGSA